MIDPRLQALRALHQHGTVAAAAEALSLTPSTVSHQLRQLSRDLGVALLRPAGRNVQLTPAAHLVLDHANIMYKQWEEAKADLALQREGQAGQLRLCGVSSAVAALLAPAAVRLRTTHPRLAVQVWEEHSADCFSSLLTEKTDIAVLIPTGDNPPPNDARFDQYPLLDEPEDLLVSKEHPLAARSKVELRDAAHESWVETPDRPDQFDVLRTACAAAGFTPRIVHHAKEWFAVSALVAHGFGVCLIPRLVPVPPEHAVSRIPLAGNVIPSRRLIIALRRGSRNQPAIAAGLDALRAIADEIAETATPTVT